MKALICYSSHHGCTENAAKLLAGSIEGSVVVNLKKDKIPDIDSFDTLLIGGSIHAGQMQKSVKVFCTNNLALLLTKKVGLFMSCMYEGETVQKQFDDNFPEEIRKHAFARGFFGGEFDFQKMNFVEKMIVRKVVKINESVSRVDQQAIRQFIEQVKAQETEIAEAVNYKL